MAPKRQFNLAKSLRPHMERPYSLVSSVSAMENVEGVDHEQRAGHEERAEDKLSPKLDPQAKNEEHTEQDSHGSLKSQRLARNEALEKFQPIAQKFRASFATANVATEVRNIFTKDTIRFLPPHEKKLLKMNAELHGATDICEWLQGAEEDIQEVSWEEKHQVTNLTEDQVKDGLGESKDSLKAPSHSVEPKMKKKSLAKSFVRRVLCRGG